MSWQWFTWADTYGVEIVYGEGGALIPAGPTVIEMTRADGNK